MKKQITPEPEALANYLKDYIPTATKSQHDSFIRYYELLVETNNFMNLTAITDPEGVASRHFADSLLPILSADLASLLPQGARVIDVGTGAGFPGIPLKIMRPDIELVLLDSLNKRLKFLDSVLTELGLSASLVHARAEFGARQPELRERFDVAVSRAVAELPILVEWTLPFLRVGGTALLYKGPGAGEELARAKNALNALCGNARLQAFSTRWGERSLVFVEKLAPTSSRFPRRAGSAEKPL